MAVVLGADMLQRWGVGAGGNACACAGAGSDATGLPVIVRPETRVYANDISTRLTPYPCKLTGTSRTNGRIRTRPFSKPKEREKKPRSSKTGVAPCRLLFTGGVFRAYVPIFLVVVLGSIPAATG